MDEHADPRYAPSITTRSFATHGSFVELGGEVDLASEPELRAAVARVIAEGHRHIVVNLTDAALIDCACIGAILSEVAPLRQEPDAVLLFAGATGIAARLLEVLEFDRVCDIVATPEAAAAIAIDPERTTAGGWRRSAPGERE